MDFTLLSIWSVVALAILVTLIKEANDYFTRKFDYLIYGIREYSDYFVADAIIDGKEAEITRSKPYDEKNIITKSEFEQEAHAHCEMLIEEMYRVRSQRVMWIKLGSLGLAIILLVFWLPVFLANVLL